MRVATRISSSQRLNRPTGAALADRPGRVQIVVPLRKRSKRVVVLQNLDRPPAAVVHTLNLTRFLPNVPGTPYPASDEESRETAPFGSER